MRKKLFTFLLALVTSVGLSWAQNPSGSCGENLSWEFNPATGTLTITGSGAMTDWSSATSRPWHSYQSDITSLSLPEGLTYIGRSAFQECPMTSVELPNSLEEIGRAAFCACGLTSVTIPDNVHTIGWSAFASCQNLSTITIGSGVTSIGYFAFSNLMIEPWPSRKLESVTCYATTPPTCDYDESFSELWNKEQVPLYVPAESVAAYSAAEDWNGFDVQAISGGSAPNPSGECGAQGDNLLWELNTSTGVLTITGSGAMYDWTSDTDRPWYSLRAQITSVVLPSGITSLGKYAFRGTDIVSINMTENYPAGLTAINQEAFFSTQLTSVTIPESVVTIGMDAFRESKTITDVYCYADPNNLTWNDYWCDDFKNADHATVCHVKACALSTYEANWGGTPYNVFNSTGVNVTFVGDLPGDCGTPTPAPSGDKLPGVFSVSGTKAVNFSKGNLQYDSDNQIWQFAANQWDYIGNAAGNNAITADGIADNNGIVDMFCWVGASSSLEGIKQYGIINAWSSSSYGSVAGEALKSDWGNIMGGDWRTLSKDEWIYLLTERTNAANLRTLGTVNGKAGLILMPDGWTASGVALTVTTANYTTNDINTTNWATLEGQGCAFLPAAGCCTSGFFDGVGGDGSYWSSTSRASGATYAHRLHFRATDVDPTDYVQRYNGMSVRLVSETTPTPTPTPTDEQVPTNVDPDNSSYHYSTFFHSTQNYKLSNDGTQAFIADLSNNELVLTEIAHGEQVIPANTAVILRKTGSADPVVLIPTQENGVSVNPNDNSLRGVDEETTLVSLSINPLQCYVLSGKSHDETESGVGFYRIYGNTLKAHKAYVIFAGGSNNAPKKMRFVYGQATGIEDVQGNNVQSTKVIENGVLYIIRDGKTYNAMGQMVK